ncbi:uncharacterized protein [Diadema antillarum]|uniref:uncharacterized protein n=1 Tax=Diadema antillarum TaxID=105358 RepID=UPI003A83C0A8
MTIEICIAMCRAVSDTEYAYAGVEFGSECYCGQAGVNYSGVDGRKSDSECQFKCSGDEYQSCGGQGNIAVFDISFPSNTTAVQSDTTTVPSDMTTVPSDTTTSKGPITSTLMTSSSSSITKLISSPSDSSSIDLRLTSDMEGTVEYRRGEGGWETVCGGSLSIFDVIVICGELGFAGANRAIQESPFPFNGTFPPVSGLGCNGGATSTNPCATSDMTIEICMAMCRAVTDAEYAYAGVAFGRECYCGQAGVDYSGVDGRKSDSECQFQCSGDEYQSCGGDGNIAVFDSEYVSPLK